MTTRYRYASIFLAIVVVACGSEAPPAPTTVPAVMTTGYTCMDPDEAPDEYTERETFTDWVSGAHAVVIGTVAELRPTSDPYANPADGPGQVTWGGDCPGRVMPAVDLRLVDVETLYGHEYDEVTIRLSSHLLGEWDAMYLEIDELEENWVIDRFAQHRGLVPGMRIGTRLYQSEHLPDQLSPAHTWPFLIDDEDRVRFERREELNPCPGEVGYFMRQRDHVRDGITLQALTDGLRVPHQGFLAGEGVPPEESSRPYVRVIWEIDEGEHQIVLGAAYCEPPLD